VLILSAVINGILYGGVLAVLAYGLNLIFGVVEIIHFAYGQCVMIGLYVIYVLVVKNHFPLLWSCLIGIAAVGLLNVFIYLFVIRGLLKAEMINQFLAMASVMIILENGCLIIWGAGYKGVPVSMPVLNIGDLFIRTPSLIAFLGSLAVLALLHVFLNKTYMGLAIRCVAQDKEAAKLMAINPTTIYIATMLMGGILAGMAACFFVPIYSVNPHFGGGFTLIAFVIVVLGGMGNLFGGFIGAFIIGVITMIFSTLANAEVGEMSAYLIFIVVILLRPQGILGARSGI